MIDHLQSIVLPSGIVTLLVLVGIAAIAFRPTRRVAAVPLVAAGLALLLFSNGLVATLLMSPLEYAYPAMQDPQRHPEAKAIVVLTAYAADDEDMPLSSRLSYSTALRVLEAANLFARRPDCQVIVSGDAVAAGLMGEQLRQLGVPEDRLLIDAVADDTADSAENLRPAMAGKQVFLVTSAGHMQRAMGVFRKRGVLAIAAPTDFQLPRSAWHAEWTWSPFHLQASDLAVHEYLALAWYRLSGEV